MNPEAERPLPNPRASSKRELTKAQNRGLILDAARRVFNEIGYSAATVRDIIGATALASGTFYNYFKSKEEVYQAIRDASALAVRPRLREARRAATTAEEFVAATFRTFFEFSARERTGEGANGKAFPRMRLDTPGGRGGFRRTARGHRGSPSRPGCCRCSMRAISPRRSSASPSRWPRK